MSQNKTDIIKQYLKNAKSSGESIFIDTNTNSYEIMYERFKI